MRILFISGELIAGDLAYRLKKEGHDVKLYIEEKRVINCFDNMIDKTDDWRKELEWVGKEGLIVFDDIGYGKIQDTLRADGYTVFGGCEEGDRLEKDREHAQIIFKKYGINTIDTLNFDTVDSAIQYIKNNKYSWVVKQNSHQSSFSYVGMMDDGSDSLSFLKSFQKNHIGNFSVSLQKKVIGLEIGVGRYFNGNDWVGPIEMNIEHKAFLDGDLGPLTAEMGTVMWYEENENVLFRESLGKLKPFLKEIDYRGDIDINCIVNKDVLVPLEATMRFGSPAIHLQDEIHLSPWSEFLLAVAKGGPYQLQFKKGYSVVVCVVIPPFPYESPLSENHLKDVDIFFSTELSPEEENRIHFEEVSLRENQEQYYIAGNRGFILYITGSGKTVEDARIQTYNLIKKIIIPDMMYRTDIGKKFYEKDARILQEWGWI